MMRWLLVAFALACAIGNAQAQTRKPTAKETAAIRDCATKYRDDLEMGERQCLFNLVATPCTKTKEGASDNGTSDCYRLETAIWDDLLNANFKALLDTLDAQQTEKARAMQRAWVAYRDATCNFYWDKIQGTMAGPMLSACVARETARRAMLLDFFGRL
ncbi:MAG TPA: lysozyme inhibitor LprI family protein [Xanthobacteraceae bacterium]|jgi:uncharacterized protein YecT (DUF1311 family)|nr:lysozyme inhibitor LprI family protein [Xanthobacteraceae bacterium]